MIPADCGANGARLLVSECYLASVLLAIKDGLVLGWCFGACIPVAHAQPRSQRAPGIQGESIL